MNTLIIFGPRYLPAGSDRRWIWINVWCQPSGSFLADQPVVGPSEGVRTQQDNQCVVHGAQLWKNRFWLPEQSQSSGLGDILHTSSPDLLRQQAVQRSLQPWASQEAARNSGHLLHSPPRSVYVWTEWSPVDVVQMNQEVICREESSGIAKLSWATAVTKTTEF